MVERKTVLIAGASGLIGGAALRHFDALSDWDVIGVSRRMPETADNLQARLFTLDLNDAEACEALAASLESVTHVVYAALSEKPGMMVEGWQDPAQMQINLRMLRNLIDPLTRTSKGFRHLVFLQGTKAYGALLHPVPVPAREDAPRDPHDSFYWLQEDYVREKAAREGWSFTILRPQIVFGDAVGVAMNSIPVFGIYAAICQELGIPFSYPGTGRRILEAVDVDLLASALEWASDTPAARNGTFNVTNGDVFVLEDLWPTLSSELGVEAGPPQPRSIAGFIMGHEEAWDSVVRKHDLRRTPLSELLGESHYATDLMLGADADAALGETPLLVSTIKIRQAGFSRCVDTQKMFGRMFASLVESRILPPSLTPKG